MERDKEILKLVNVLRRTSRMAIQAEWTGAKDEAAKLCVEQHNLVLNRLKEIDPSVASVFNALPSGSSLTVAAMACRQLAAYYEDEVGSSRGWSGWGHVYGLKLDPEVFKAFWRKSANEVEDFAEFIRENIEELLRIRKGKSDTRESKREPACGPTAGKSSNP